jgi:ABC-type sugar transport system permease subunit
MLNCLTKVWNYLIPVVIFIYVFTLIGLDVFAGRLYFDENDNSIPKFADLSKYKGVYRPRGNFDNILNAGIVVF